MSSIFGDTTDADFSNGVAHAFAASGAFAVACLTILAVVIRSDGPGRRHL